MSPRSRKTDKVNVTCSSCSESMQQVNIKLKCPPKFAIANDCAIVSFQKVFSYTDKHGNDVRTKLNIEQGVNDVLRVLLAPIRPYDFVTAVYGGSHQSVHGH